MNLWEPFACQSCAGAACERCGGTGYGPQYRALATGAKYILFGGAAGGGKSQSIAPWFMGPGFEDPRYIGLVVRREKNDLRVLIEKAQAVFCRLGRRRANGTYTHAGTWQEVKHRFLFPWGAQIEYRHLDDVRSLGKYDGYAYDRIAIDEGVQIDGELAGQLSARLRSNVPGLQGQILVTSNPPRPHEDPWPKTWWAPWLLGEAREKPGVVRWFVTAFDDDGKVKRVWLEPGLSAEQREAEARRIVPGERVIPESAVYIPARVADNPIYAASGYASQLRLAGYVRSRQLIEGDWQVTYDGGSWFRRSWFLVHRQDWRTLQGHVQAAVRFWDRAGTKPGPKNENPDWTRGVLLIRMKSGLTIVGDVIGVRDVPGRVRSVMLAVAGDREAHGQVRAEYPGLEPDPAWVWQCQNQDPAQAGIDQANGMIADWRRLLRKCCVYVERGDVEQRAEPAHKAVYNDWQAKKPWILCEGQWTESFIAELQAFPSKHWHDDQVVAVSNGLLLLEEIVAHGRPLSGRER